MGSAHAGAELALLLAAARDRLVAGQEVLDLGQVAEIPPRMAEVADWTASRELRCRGRPAGGPVSVAGGGRVVGTSADLLWALPAEDLFVYVYVLVHDLILTRAVVIPRRPGLIVAYRFERAAASAKAEVVRVLEEIGAPGVRVRTLFRSLARSQDRDYRGQLATTARAHSVATAGTAALVLYDVTTLHFERDDEDDLRKIGLSKEHRIDSQVQAALLVGTSGFPLEVHLFEGNKAATATLIPVLTAFADRHGVSDIVVVADARLLSAGNLNGLEDAGFNFIVGSRITRAPYDLTEHFERHCTYFTDGLILESSRRMGTGKAARTRRVVYQWKLRREKHDNKAINAMIERAEKIADGRAPLRKARFLKLTDLNAELDQAAIDRARQLAGLKGHGLGKVS